MDDSDELGQPNGEVKKRKLGDRSSPENASLSRLAHRLLTLLNRIGGVAKLAGEYDDVLKEITGECEKVVKEIDNQDADGSDNEACRSAKQSPGAAWNRERRSLQRDGYRDLIVALLYEWVSERNNTTFDCDRDRKLFTEKVLECDAVMKKKAEFESEYGSLYVVLSKKMVQEIFDKIARDHCNMNGLYVVPRPFPVYRSGAYSSYFLRVGLEKDEPLPDGGPGGA